MERAAQLGPGAICCVLVMILRQLSPYERVCEMPVIGISVLQYPFAFRW